MHDEIIKIKAALFDLDKRLRSLEEVVDFLLEAEADTAEELAEHEIEDEAEHAAIVHLVERE